MRVLSFQFLLLVFGLFAGLQTSAAGAPLVLNQRLRTNEICRNSAIGSRSFSGAELVQELQGLANDYRARALECLLPKQSFVLSVPQQIEIIGATSIPRIRRQIICRLAAMLPLGLQASEASNLYGTLTGQERLRALTCTGHKFAENLSATDVITLLGPIMSKPDPSWTLSEYTASQHIAGLCRLAPLLRGGLRGSHAAELLGLSRNQDRLRAVSCLTDKLDDGLAWEEVDQIVGPSIEWRGAMVDRLGKKMPDGAKAELLSKFHGEYVSKRFLVDPDPPGWLNGQCVAWAKLAFARVSRRPLSIAVGVAQDIPERAENAGFVVEQDPKRAKVGALIIWRHGKAGHVGIVTNVWRATHSGEIKRIAVSESNWGIATDAGARRWGITLEKAKAEYVTSQYGYYAVVTLATDALDRAPPGAKGPLSYEFIGYVLPE